MTPPIGALIALLSGQKPQEREPSSIEDLLRRPDLSQPVAPPDPIDRRFGGELTDQRGPVKPPLMLRDQSGVYKPGLPDFEGKSGFQNDFPLLPAGDVMDFPGKNFHRPVGPTPNSADYMIGRKTDPNISPVSPDRQFWEDWMRRQLNRKRIEDMGGLRG